MATLHANPAGQVCAPDQENIEEQRRDTRVHNVAGWLAWLMTAGYETPVARFSALLPFYALAQHTHTDTHTTGRARTRSLITSPTHCCSVCTTCPEHSKNHTSEP